MTAPRSESPSVDRTAFVIRTPRLALHELVDADAAFILELVNDEAWLRNIGDRGVRNLDDARAYIANGPRASYVRHGFGLWRLERSADAVPIGLCGLLKRDTLDDVDIGFALLPQHVAHGYAFEAASACVAHARDVLKLERLVAIVSPANTGSIRLIEKLGLRFEGHLAPTPDGKETDLYGGALRVDG